MAWLSVTSSCLLLVLKGDHTWMSQVWVSLAWRYLLRLDIAPSPSSLWLAYSAWDPAQLPWLQLVIATGLRMFWYEYFSLWQLSEDVIRKGRQCVWGRQGQAKESVINEIKTNIKTTTTLETRIVGWQVGPPKPRGQKSHRSGSPDQCSMELQEEWMKN